jgi:hypothetical protein
MVREFEEVAYRLRREWLERVSWLRCLLKTHDEGDLTYQGQDPCAWQECLEGVRELYMMTSTMSGVPAGLDPFLVARQEEIEFEKRLEGERRETNAHTS